MLKKYLLLLLLPIVAGCDKSDSGVVDTTKPIVYHKVPNMVSDTLVSTTFSGNTYVYDTLYTAADAENTYIYYKNNVYKLKAFEQPGKHFSDSAGYYLCDLYDMNDTKMNTAKAGPLKVTSSKTWNTIYKEWSNTRQTIEANIPPFPPDAAIYKGRE